MIISPFTEDNNSRFPTMTQPYFDDHLVRRDHTLQLLLKQLAPALLEGGRAILWFCHLCQKPWYEVGRRASFLCLSASQLTEIAQQLGVKIGTLSSLPRSICPQCASLYLGGIPTIEEYLDSQGYRFSWQTRTRRHTRLFCQIYRWNLRSISEVLLEGDSVPCDVPISSEGAGKKHTRLVENPCRAWKGADSVAHRKRYEEQEPASSTVTRFCLVWLWLEEFMPGSRADAGDSWYDLSRLVHLLIRSPGGMLAADRAGD
jgi:hypothetical protein